MYDSYRKMIKNTIIPSILLGCCLTSVSIKAQPLYKDPSQPVEVRVEDLLSKMTLKEKIQQMESHANYSDVVLSTYCCVPFKLQTNKRLGIPPFIGTGASRGGFALGTAFPVSIARGASWDRDLEYRVNVAMAKEAAALGANILFSPTINLLRHPGWGRAQETFGEDTYHLGEMGVSAINGIQTKVMAQVKHFALNSIEEDRFTINHKVDPRSLHEVYLPHFKKAIDKANVASFMSAYNKVNGAHMGQNKPLLKDILRDQWGFKGFTMSDWYYIDYDTEKAINAGLDIEMPVGVAYTESKIRAALDNGSVEISTIDNAIRNILRRKFEYGLFEKPISEDKAVIQSQAHFDLSLEAARKSITLLKNTNNALPINRDNVKKIAVFGKSSFYSSLGDLGSSAVWALKGRVSPLKGIKNLANGVEIKSYVGINPIIATWEALFADVVVVVASLTPFDEGENIPEPAIFGIGGDRKDLSLHQSDINIIKAAASVNKRVIVVIQAGSAVTLDDWGDKVEGIVTAWYPGLKGGTAIAEVLFGDINPSGKTPVSFPKHENDLYTFGSGDAEVTYGFLHGYRYFDKYAVEPEFHFGHGLSYTTFDYSNLVVTPKTKKKGKKYVSVSVDISNTGKRSGAEVVQLYIGYPHSFVERAVKELKGFTKVELEAGETKTVEMKVPYSELKFYNSLSDSWTFENTDYLFYVGASSGDIRLTDQSLLVK
jgi:beta-glucosidase